MARDPSNGYDAGAAEFIARRDASSVGAEAVRAWAQSLPSCATVLDLGCGSGEPVSRVLIEAGHEVFGVDASPAMVETYRRRFPGRPVSCEPAQRSDFFARRFDAAVAWGLLFLLSPSDQEALIHRVGRVLVPGGRFIFTAPAPVATWIDVLTGLPSESLGADRYWAILHDAGFVPVDAFEDEGENHYFDARRTGL